VGLPRRDRRGKCAHRSVLFIPTLAVRAVLEERELKAELEGCDEYLHEGRYRVIPGIC
jgi:hypothetical protein